MVVGLSCRGLGFCWVSCFWGWRNIDFVLCDFGNVLVGGVVDDVGGLGCDYDGLRAGCMVCC